MGSIGPDKAGYITLIYPVIALITSTVFEDYGWTLSAMLGVIILLLGNFIAMGKYKQLSFIKKKVYVN